MSSTLADIATELESISRPFPVENRAANPVAAKRTY